MADRYIFSTVMDAKAVNGEFTRVATGGTLTGSSAIFNVVFDDAEFDGAEGKVALINHLEEVLALLRDVRTIWPLTA